MLRVKRGPEGSEGDDSRVVDEQYVDAHADEYEPRLHETYCYPAVVEDNADPEHMGRVKARVPQVHWDTQAILTSDLPWAYPKHHGALRQFGPVDVPPVGSIVWVEFFCHDLDYPIYTRGYHAVRRERDDLTGVDVTRFREIGPIDEQDPEPLNEMPSMFRNYQPAALRARKGNDAFAAFGQSRTEPENPYLPDTNGINAEVYPKNRGFRTESGIVVEFDDQNERIHVWHPTGTYQEIDRHGNVITKVKQDTYLVIDRNADVHVFGQRTTKIHGDEVLEVENLRIKVLNDFILEVGRDIIETAGQNIERTAVGHHYDNGNPVDHNP